MKCTLTTRNRHVDASNRNLVFRILNIYRTSTKLYMFFRGAGVELYHLIEDVFES